VNFAEVYIDESGSHDASPILSVAGYVFKKDRAIQFDNEWRVVLEAEELPYFRMSACAHCTGPFDGWTNDECDVVERKLIRLTRRTSAYGFAVTVNEDEYNSIGPRHDRLGSAYSFCLRMCLVAVRSWIQEADFTGDIAYFFEAGHSHQAEASRIMDSIFAHPLPRSDYRYLSHTFADKTRARPLQAADLLAWQWHTDAKRKRSGIRVSRKDLQALIRSQDLAMDWTKERLVEVAAEVRAGRVIVL
jgi:hypothetical protein